MPDSADMELLERVRHPNILPFLACWETPQHVVLVTELMLGGNLKEFLRHTGHPRLHVLQAWSRQLLNALHYLHTRKPRIVHRDVNCANIFVEGRLLKLGNLALAQVMHDGSASGIVGMCPFVCCADPRMTLCH